MTAKDEIKKSFLASLWFMFLTFPLMVIRVNTVTDTVEWRWLNMALVGIGAFVLSMLWRYLLKRQAEGSKKEKKTQAGPHTNSASG